MRLFLLLIYFGLFLNERVSSQSTDNIITEIKTYVNKVDSLSSIKTFLTTDKDVKAQLIPTISEGPIENKKRGLKGGFSIETVTSSDMDTLYIIKHHDNIEKNLYKSYYYRSGRLVFSKIELQDDGDTNATLFLEQEYYMDDKVVLSTIDKNKLRQKYKWRVDFDPLTDGYLYYKKFKEKGANK
jgi:hypothetical protein